MIEIHTIEQNEPIQETPPKQKEPIKKSKVVMRIFIVMIWVVFLTLLFFQEARDFALWEFNKIFGPEEFRFKIIPLKRQ